MHFTHRGFGFRLLSTKDCLSGLVVETPSVELPLGWKPKPDPKATMPTLTTPPEPYRSLVQQEVRAIRGALVFWGVFDIDVDQPDIEYLPETAVERAELDVLGFNLKRSPRMELPVMQALPDMIVRCVLSRAHFAPYELPFEFYRRGGDDCYDSHFVQAIFNFFFVLEYLFGEGKFKATQIETAFCKSADLQAGTAEAQKILRWSGFRSTRWIKAAEDKYVRRTFVEIVRSIIELRGFLHHQSLKRRRNWNPGMQSEFEPDAQFLKFLCQSVLIKPAIDILFARSAMNEFISTPVYGPDNQQIRWRPVGRNAAEWEM